MRLLNSCIFTDTISLNFPIKIPENAVFFDIETTGLSRRKSHLYLIGCAYFNPAGAQTGWNLRQWFAERPGEEPELLRAFTGFLESRDAGNRPVLVHYNGTGFDLPYLTARYEFYGMHNPLPDLDSIDLYRTILPFKKLLRMNSLRQRDLERFLGLGRTDPCTGGELIAVYQEYLRSAGQADLDALLLHNADDIRHLIPLYSVRAYEELAQGGFSVASFQCKEACAEAHLNLSRPLPAAIRTANGPVRFSAEGNAAVLTLPVCEGELRHYFPDYQNYFYLPDEDMAIHKSVGQFVDPAHRRKATAGTCYTRGSGRFLPQTGRQREPFFCESPKDRQTWFRIPEQEPWTDTEGLRAYVLEWLQVLL